MRPAVCLLLGLCCGGTPADGASLRAGAAVVEITPPIGVPLWGYASRHDAPSVGVLDPLFARAVVLEIGQQRIALVSLDLGRPPTRASVAAIREKAREANVAHLLLVASHTHHGPVIELDHWPTPQNSYVRQLERKLGDVILQAARSLRPARLGCTSAATTLNRNRHSRRPDAPVDRELLVLRLEGPDGKPIAHAVNFAAHPTTMDRTIRQFSADFPGAMARLVERDTGVPCLFLQGAAGDLSPNQAEHAGPKAFGEALGREVLRLLPRIRCPSDDPPSVQIREEERVFRSRVDLTNPFTRAALSAAFFPDLIAFYEREYREGIRTRLTTALVNGRIGLVGVSGEFFCGHSLSLKRRARLDHVLFLGYCNDFQQYFPTIEAAAQGGYGAVPPMAIAELGAGEQIIDRALIELYRMQGKFPAD
ncbi:MAG: neutral/alkaline non-lysosomal ceramidase N-terminal domain-containing protein [Gemmataceae bacterium]|nr:neutral/alkaline non-lysosomal ceramidase N-terminal domain-containing protein [Gemmataceae bacterium]MDW8264824.1 neutral/alkaline non-lysosomal ceramidase N-terminal domain-containing protein [Gemmataceae bacterium]